MVNGCGPLLSWIMLSTLLRPAISHQSKQSHQQKTAEDDSSITCYTCVNVSDNMMCNRYAIDRPCPKGEDFCHTLHIMDSNGASVVVNKKCADATECWPLGVGCVMVDTQTVCVSCCDEMYCNVTVPTNQSNAIYSSKRNHSKTKSKPPVQNVISASASASSIGALATLILLLMASHRLLV